MVRMGGWLGLIGLCLTCASLAFADDVPPELVEIATEIANSVNENGLCPFPNAGYPLYIVQDGSPAARVIASADDFPPAGESLHMRAESIRVRLMPGAAFLAFDVASDGEPVPCYALLTRSGLPLEAGGLPSYEVDALAVGSPGAVLTERTAAVDVLVHRLAESFIAGEVHGFIGAGKPLILVDGTSGRVSERPDLPGPPLAGHAGPIDDVEILTSRDVGAISMTLSRDGGPVAVVMMVALVDGTWRVPVICAGPSLGPIFGAPAVAGDQVIAGGEPPLLGRDVEDCTALFGFVLDLALSAADREKIREALSGDFARSDAPHRRGLLAVCRGWQAVTELTPASRWTIRRKLLDDLLIGARTEQGLATTQVFLDLYARTLDVVVPGPSPLTRDAAESHARLLCAVSSIVANGALDVPADYTKDLVAEVVRAYPRMGEDDRALVRSSVYTWARVQMVWQSADTAARKELVDSLRASMSSAVSRAERGGAFVPPAVLDADGGKALMSYLDGLFPKDKPPPDLSAEIGRAERDGHGDAAAVLSQVRHELVRDLTGDVTPPAEEPVGPGR